MGKNRHTLSHYSQLVRFSRNFRPKLITVSPLNNDKTSSKRIRDRWTRQASVLILGKSVMVEPLDSDLVFLDKYKSAVNDKGVYKNGVPELKEHHSNIYHLENH